MTPHEKICEIMGWEIIGSAEHTVKSELEAFGVSPERVIPDELILDVVLANGIKNYVLQHNFGSLQEIEQFIFELFKRTLNSRAFANPKHINIFPMLGNFFIYCQRIDRNGKKDKEASIIAETCWYGELAEKRLQQRTAEMFSIEPNEEIFRQTVSKIKEIWRYSDYEIDAIRYFVCQVKKPDIMPQLNKSLFFQSTEKNTGKTTVASSIICALNGENFIDSIGKYSSTLGLEMQYNTHDKPKVIGANAILLDEQMPADTKKMYGQLKSMLTSRGCTVNIKFGAQVNVDCRRNYILASNYHISEFIKDDKERRFVTINPQCKPKQISFEEVFDIWKTFCQHATPKKPFPEWYLDFEFIDGKFTKDVNEAKDNILYHNYLLEEIENSKKHQITVGTFYKALTGTQTPQSDVKRTIKQACLELFGETIVKGQSTWYAKDVIMAIKSAQPDMYSGLTDEDFKDINNKKNDGLPF